METTIVVIGKKVKYFVGYDKGERLKMGRKVLKNWDRPFAHTDIFFSLRPPPIQAKIVEAAPFSHPPPPSPLLMTGPLEIMI
jgi:hypothetical protein